MSHASFSIATLLVTALSACSAGDADHSRQIFSTSAGGKKDSNGAGGTQGLGGHTMALFAGASSDGVGGDIFGGGVQAREAGVAKCGGITSKGQLLPLDLYFMYDRSRSMTCPIAQNGATRWKTVGDAFNGFVNAADAKGINVGIQYFGNNGLDSSCAAADYQAPAVEFAALPSNAGPLITSLTGQQPDTNTPTAPALQAAITHATEWKAAPDHAGHTVSVVLVTDGQPSACGAVADVVAAATDGLSKNGIKTYVIGIISPDSQCIWDPGAPNQADLDSVAKAGGTDAAFMVDVTQDASKKFLDAMNKIRIGAQVPCQYQVPEPPPGMGKVNPDKVNVHFTPPGGAETTIYGVDESACGAPAGGWFYNTTKTTISLCPNTCAEVTGQAGGEINISVGCDTEHPPK